MTTHEVAQGECLSKIAARYGLTWRTLWDDPANAQLRAKRKDPNILWPGDIVTIPEPPAERPRVPVLLDGTTTVIRFRVGFRPLQLRVLDAEGEPLAETSYSLELEGGETRSGLTDETGVLREELPVGMSRATLSVGELRFELEIGHLNPLEGTEDGGISGAKARLRNLGYRVAAIDGDAKTARGPLAAFQADEELDPTGELDGPTRERLRARHEC